MTTMLERAARALCAEEHAGADQLADIVDDKWEHHISQARAVLMAVRVPCSDVVESGMIAGQFGGMADVAFTAMIDAILNKKDTTND